MEDMIDFVKLVYTHRNFGSFQEKHKEKIKAVLHLDSGEIEYPYSFQHDHYTVKIWKIEAREIYFIQVTGSLHKNHFDGANHERFTFDKLVKEIDYLSESLGLEAEKLMIKNLEVGVNLPTPFAPYPYLKENLLLYKTNALKAYDKGKDGKELGYFHDGIPQVKIYDKGKQYDLPVNLMRFELRYKKSTTPRKLGIQCLKDLQDREKLLELSKELESAWDNVLLYESDLIERHPLISKKHKQLYKRYGYYQNWIKTLENSNSRVTFYNHKKRFKEIIKAYGRNIHGQLARVLRREIEKCTERTYIETEELYEITDTLKGNIVHSQEEKGTETY